MKKGMKINPKEGKKVKIDVEGYGCGDDCYDDETGDTSPQTCPFW